MLAFAGPIGCGINLVVSEAKMALESVGYEVHVIKLSKIIETALEKGTVSLDAEEYKKFSPTVKRIMRLQDGGMYCG